MGFSDALGKLIRRRGADREPPAQTGNTAPPVKPYVADVTRHGLAPDDQVSAEEVLTEPLAGAVQAAARGEWAPAAELLRSTAQDWDMRAHYAHRLGVAAAEDDRWLTTWRHAQPNAADAAVVQAESLVALAWKVRTGLRAQHVSRDQFAGFHRLLGEAEQCALGAARLVPADPTPWMTLVTICRGLEHDQNRLAAIWSELIARAPYHRSGHEQALQYWCKKWFGSHERMFEFARHAATLAPSLTPMPLIAAVEYWSAEDVSMLKTPETQAAADVVVRDWLSGPGANSPQAVDDRSLVATALTFGGRGMQAVQHFRMLGTRGDSWIWRHFGDPPKKFLQVRNLACIKAENAMTT